MHSTLLCGVRRGLAVLFAACLLLSGCASQDNGWLNNPLDQADQTFRWADFGDWAQDADRPGGSFFYSETTPTAFGFTELLPSWNPAGLQAGYGLTMWVRSRDAQTQTWSPWLFIGRWGDAPVSEHEGVTSFAFGEVAIDILELQRPADAFQIGIGYITQGEGRVSRDALSKVTVVVGGPAKEAAKRWSAPLSDEDQRRVEAGDWRRDLAVPFLPQKMLPRRLWRRGCSPTATTMVLRYRGLEACDPTRTARAVYDKQHDIYGNWGRAVAYAGSLGLDAEPARFRTWDQLKASIARGRPVVASIRFEEGEFPSNPMGQTDGHLIVIRGLTPDGDAIVNDPALSDDNAGDGVVYNAEELARAWLGKGGVAYVIGGPAAGDAE